METWLAVAIIAVVVAVGLAVLAIAALRTAAAVKRLVNASRQTGVRFHDALGLLHARRAGLRVLVAERKVRNTDPTQPQVPSLKGRQEKDLIG